MNFEKANGSMRHHVIHFSHDSTAIDYYNKEGADRAFTLFKTLSQMSIK